MLAAVRVSHLEEPCRVWYTINGDNYDYNYV